LLEIKRKLRNFDCHIIEDKATAALTYTEKGQSDECDYRG
jgi:hypothetical protein